MKTHTVSAPAGDAPIRFESARLTVRPFEAEEIEAFAAYRNDLDWMRYQGFKGRTLQQYHEALLGPQAMANGLQLALVHTGTGALVGDLYLKADGQTALIGYTVAPAYARQGYAGEAVRALLAWLSQHGYRVARADVAPENAASVALLRKLGFTQVGTDGEGDLRFEMRVSRDAQTPY